MWTRDKTLTGITATSVQQVNGVKDRNGVKYEIQNNHDRTPQLTVTDDLQHEINNKSSWTP